MTSVIIEEVRRPTALYRIGSPTGEGLWYDGDGASTGLVHWFAIKAAALPMGFHPIFSDGGSKWISVTDSLETLANWFTPEEVETLSRHGYRMEVIAATAHRTLTFPDYGYSHQVYRVEDVTGIEYLDHTNLHRRAA